jgi:tripartite-type tricarboxylate transporter receptor subunit TctC
MTAAVTSEESIWEERMKKYLVKSLIYALAVVPMLATSERAWSQAWPSRAVTVVVPYGPGGSNDLIARALANLLSKKFSQPFVVENRAGAGGFTGSQQVSRATPDGYTLLLNSNTIVATEPVMKVKFDVTKDLTPISMLAQSPNTVVINAGVPAKNVAEFIAYAKANPDNTFYGVTALGGTQHTHAEQFNLLTGTKLKPVVYKSSADAQTDLVAGRLKIMFATLASVAGQIQSGDLRLIGYTGPGSPPGVPAAPTMEEAGIKGFEGGIWWGIFGPAKMPSDLQATINKAVNEAVQSPELVALLHKSGATPVEQSAPQFSQAIDREVTALNDMIKALNLKFE